MNRGESGMKRSFMNRGESLQEDHECSHMRITSVHICIGARRNLRHRRGVHPDRRHDLHARANAPQLLRPRRRAVRLQGSWLPRACS
jgi:hypothetical protein